MNIHSKRLTKTLVLCVFLVSSASQAQTFRQKISLSGDWLFAIDSAKSNTTDWSKGIPAKSVKVKVPHTWNTTPGLEKYAGKGWYQYDVEISASQLQKLVRLQFDAVYHNATVYINGQKAGSHAGSGFNKFFIDVSPYIRPGKNRIIVCADNSFSRENIPFLKSFDWANDGGIIRKVYLITTDKQAIKNIQITATPEGTTGLAGIKIALLDPSIKPDDVRMKATITEENQATKNSLFTGDMKTTFTKGTFQSTLSFHKIKPWHFDHPNLYKITVALYIRGKQVDEFSSVFVFRSLKTEKDRFVLNGEPMRLMGIEWMVGSTLERGMAEDTNDFKKNLILMKNVNCIYTRFHFQQDEFVLDWCDRNGILIQEEIPYWGAPTLLNDTLLRLGYQHLDEMVSDHYNHPSIISWGVGNELESRKAINISSIEKLYKYAKSLDSTRQVNYVSNKLGFHRFDNQTLLDELPGFAMC